jgi:hypothetical protein
LEIVRVSDLTAYSSLFYRLAAMRDEVVIEEMEVRAIQERMDEAFRAAMQRATALGALVGLALHRRGVVDLEPGSTRPER